MTVQMRLSFVEKIKFSGKKSCGLILLVITKKDYSLRHLKYIRKVLTI